MAHLSGFDILVDMRTVLVVDRKTEILIDINPYWGHLPNAKHWVPMDGLFAILARCSAGVPRLADTGAGLHRPLTSVSYYIIFSTSKK